jgi:seryl-tRNA synthetase
MQKKLFLIMFLCLLPSVFAYSDNETVYVLTDYDDLNYSTLIVYDGNMVSGQNALVHELKQNITTLKEELREKDKQLSSYIVAKAENVELKENITKLNSKIKLIEAEKEILKTQNDGYQDMITDLINTQSNDTKDINAGAYNNAVKTVNNFKLGVLVGVIVCLVLFLILRKRKKQFDFEI